MRREIMPRCSLSNGSEMEKWNIGTRYEYPPQIQRDLTITRLGEHAMV